MRVLVRCDADRSSGVGHLGRALALTEASRARSWEVVLCGRVEGTWAQELVAAADLDVRPATDDPEALADLAVQAGAQVLHLDHYGDLGPRHVLHEETRNRHLTLSAVADFSFGARDADLIVNPNYGADEVTPGSIGRYLGGPSFGLVRAAVRAAREERALRENHAALDGTSRGAALRCVVVMGGTDPFGATAPAVELLAEAAEEEVDVEVLTADHQALRSRYGSTLGWLRLEFLPPQGDLPKRFAASDMAVSAAGTTLLELSCIGVPAALLCVTENQARGYSAAVAAGTALGLGTLAAPVGPAPLRMLLGDATVRAQLAAAGRRTVDGLGPDRVLDAMAEHHAG